MTTAMEHIESQRPSKQEAEMPSVNFVALMKESCPGDKGSPFDKVFMARQTQEPAELEFKDPFHRAADKADSSGWLSDSKVDPVTLKTGDKLTDDGKKAELSMPSGEKLVVSGNNWALMDADGKELSSNKHMAQGKLPDGAYVDHIVPIMGPGWTTINYPNGDNLSIREGKVTVRRGDEASTFYAPNAMPEPRQRDRWN